MSKHWKDYRSDENFKRMWSKAVELDWATQDIFHDMGHLNEIMRGYPYSDRFQEFIHHLHELWLEDIGSVIHSVPLERKFCYKEIKNQKEKYKEMAISFELPVHNYPSKEITECPACEAGIPITIYGENIGEDEQGRSVSGERYK